MITIDELKYKLEDNSRLIGLDLGTKRVGVAISDNKRKIATPMETIEYKNMEFLIKKLKQIIKDNYIFGIIIGNPINMDGSLGKSAQSINDKAKVICEEVNHFTALWDERLSTSGSFNISSNLDIKFKDRKKNIDAKAAAFILQGAIDYLNN
tara:strand:+ start:68 stop:523 length:456 start_codon:yes stop_codon:yes gene_type:complete